VFPPIGAISRQSAEIYALADAGRIRAIRSPTTNTRLPIGELTGRYYPDADVRYDGDGDFVFPIERSHTRAWLEGESLYSWRRNV
jgi:hypothetical protein